MSTPATLVALLHGPDQPGLVAKTSGWIYARQGNILHADQHRDMEAGEFFQRIEWVPAGANAAAEAEELRKFAATLGMSAKVAVSTHRARGALFVSKEDHCFHDLALRAKAGEFAGDFACVISNHTALADAARHYGLPFHHVPVTPATKAEAERHQLEILRAAGTEFVVLARYMQVLSPEFVARYAARIINIHHSFLPAFVGANPYRQAYEKGVKLIGATSHYVTAELDQGPIIEQDTIRCTHQDSVEDLVRKGRDLEKRVLAQAVRSHLEDRILVYAGKTVVFD